MCVKFLKTHSPRQWSVGHVPREEDNRNDAQNEYSYDASPQRDPTHDPMDSLVSHLLMELSYSVIGEERPADIVRHISTSDPTLTSNVYYCLLSDVLVDY